MFNLPLVLSMVCAGLVGVVFTGSGFLKAVDPAYFAHHLRQQRLLPRKALYPAAISFIAFECGLGTALLLQVFPHTVLPASILLLIGLAILSEWSISSGRTEDCGCYGGWIELSRKQRILQSVLYVLLIGVAWLMLPADTQTSMWQLIITLAVALVGMTLVVLAIFHEKRTGQRLFFRSPLNLGVPVKTHWIGEGPGPPAMRGEQLVVYLGLQCPYCTSWVRVLNSIHRTAGMPEVVGVLAAEDADRERYAEDLALTFPLTSISSARLRYLAPSLPTSILVRDGVIEDWWVGLMSESFSERYMAAFFPEVVSREHDKTDNEAS